MADLCQVICLNNLRYLEKIPQEYQCVYAGSTEAVSCVPEDFCTDPNVISYSPNMELSDSYDNWVEKLGLECASGFQIGAIGSAFFLGWVITLAFIPRFSDLYGRQVIISVANVVNAACLFAIITTQSYNVMLAFLLIQGMTYTAIMQIGCLYIYENTTRVNYANCVAAIFTIEGL